VRAGPPVEAHLVADDVTEAGAELLGDALGDGARGDPPRLGVPDRAAYAAPELQADLRQLCRLARARLPRHDDDLMVADRRRDVADPRGDRQRGGIVDGGYRGTAAGHAALRLGDGVGHLA